MVKDEDLVELSKVEFWDARYTSEQQAERDGTQPGPDSSSSHEWFRTFETLRPFFTKYLPAPPSACHILHLGCGSSVSSRIALPSSPLFGYPKKISED